MNSKHFPLIACTILILSALIGCCPPAPSVQSTAVPSIQSTAVPPVQPTTVPSIQSTAVPSVQPTAARVTAVADLRLLEDEIATLDSLEKIDDYPLYTMHFQGAYDQNRNQASAFAGPGWACSLFAAMGNADDMTYGRNFDWEYSPALLLFTDPPDGYASVSMVDIAYLVEEDQVQSLIDLPLADREALLDAPFWPFDGMNEHGLVVGMAAVPESETPNDPDKEMIDSLSIIREMLDHARDADEAIAIMENYNITWSGGPSLHYLIADASGRAVLVEFQSGQMIVIPNEAPFHLATNHLRVTASADGGCHRYATLDERLTETEGRLAPQEAVDLLEDVAQGGTQWSIVYGFSTGTVYVVMGQEYDTVHTLHLSPSDTSSK